MGTLYFNQIMDKNKELSKQIAFTKFYGNTPFVTQFLSIDLPENRSESLKNLTSDNVFVHMTCTQYSLNEDDTKLISLFGNDVEVIRKKKLRPDFQNTFAVFMNSDKFKEIENREEAMTELREIVEK